MKEYRVVWEIDIEAVNAESAAILAEMMMRDPLSIGKEFTVIDKATNAQEKINLGGQKSLPFVTYEVDEAGEATGIVHYFCQRHAPPESVLSKEGIAGQYSYLVCEECGCVVLAD